MIVLCGGCRYDFTPRWLKWGSSFVKAALMRPDLASIKSWEKIKGGRWINWSSDLFEGGGPSLSGLSHHATSNSPQPQASMSHLREGGARDKTNTIQKGGAWGGEQLQLLSRRKGELRRKYHYQVGAHLVTTEAYILNCTLHLSLKKYLRGILDLLLCSAVETNEASKRWQVYLLFFASRSKARHKFTTTDIRSVVNRKS